VAEKPEKDERIRRQDGDDYEERGDTGRPEPPADDPDEDDVPPLTEPGAET